MRFRVGEGLHNFKLLAFSKQKKRLELFQRLEQLQQLQRLQPFTTPPKDPLHSNRIDKQDLLMNRRGSDDSF
jgi:hypothetical protein